MCRSLLESARANVYVPAGRTMPGTSNASVNVILVCLFHSSAFALGNANPKTATRHNAAPNLLTECIIRFLSSDNQGRTYRELRLCNFEHHTSWLWEDDVEK